MTIRACSPRGSEWPADYRSDAVELYRWVEAGVITRAELQCQLLEKYPDKDVPDWRTLRRWAREKYRDLPEQREQLLGPQAIRTNSVQQVLGTSWGYRPSLGGIRVPSMPYRISESVKPVMQFAVLLTMLGLAASMSEHID